MKKFFFISMCSILQLTYSQTHKIDTILWSGPNENRINMIILGDGYQTHELNKFLTDANNFTNKLFQITPYREYKNYFNVFAIEVPSNESGAIHNGNATDIEENQESIRNVDNYFGSTFDYLNIHRLLVPTNTAAIYNVLASNFPEYDQVLMLVNSNTYGGSGGTIAVASTNTNSSQIAIHELGHSFANLKDEYYAGEAFVSEGINQTQETDLNNLKWKKWLNFNEVGLYQLSNGNIPTKWYRPHQNCKMRKLGSPLCSVCVEGNVQKIHSLVNSIDSYYPENKTPINFDTTTTYSIKVVELIPNKMDVTWSLNGNILSNKTYTTSIPEDELLIGTNELKAIVKNTTPLQKTNDDETVNSSAIVWNINYSGANNSDPNSVTSKDDQQHILKGLNLEIFPNPTYDFINLRFSKKTEADYKVIITDLSGKEVMYLNIIHPNKNQKIQLSQLEEGIYIINLYVENDRKFFKKLVKI